jgi:hypothetical protein
MVNHFSKVRYDPAQKKWEYSYSKSLRYQQDFRWSQSSFDIDVLPFSDPENPILSPPRNLLTESLLSKINQNTKINSVKSAC